MPAQTEQALNSTSCQHSTIDLAGLWRLRLDEDNCGIREEWYRQKLSGRVMLPGSLPVQGIGQSPSTETQWIGDIVDRSWFSAAAYAPYRQPGNIKIPFWLQPETHFVGAAWYQREVEVRTSWVGRRVVLHLERPHWRTDAWLDGHNVGSNDSLSVPHAYELGTVGVDLQPGVHTLTLRIDNSLIVDVGVNSHSISDHTQGNWNGIIGRVELTATAPAWIDDLQVYPEAGDACCVRGLVKRDRPETPLPAEVTMVLDGTGIIGRADVAATGEFSATCRMPTGSLRWNEFSPALHRLIARLSNGDERAVSFGLRTIATAGTQFVIDGNLVFFRGTLECCIFPQTGHPPTDAAAWRRIMLIAQAHGLNMLRFHSWCPPEAAFVAADELGLYLQVEAATWPNQSTTIGDGKSVDTWVHAETERILRTYGNHPSFVLMAAGNEPGGEKHRDYLAKWVNHFKVIDRRRLFTSAAGWPELAENQFHLLPEPRIYRWQDELRSRINAAPPETTTDYREFITQRAVPVISHEIGEWCAYPNFDEIAKYSGHLKPRNFEIFRDSLAQRGMLHQASDFVQASGKLQTLCYKEEIESALRTPGMGGFHLLDLHDFPGQGTALVGVLDAFWESKGYVTPEQFKRFCNSTVPLARLRQRVFTTDQQLVADLEIAHFGPTPLSHVVPQWQLVADDGRIVAKGTLAPRIIPIGNGAMLGKVSVPLQDVPAPARYRLIVSIAHTPFENDWDVWVYPPLKDVHVPENVTLARDVDTAAAALQQGRSVLLTLPPNRIRGDSKGPVGLGFSPIFWNTAWTQGQKPHTLGILCDPTHPALAAFPTDTHSNWQWWYPIHCGTAMLLDNLPRDVHPIVQVIDDWASNRKLALCFEARVNSGRLLVCSADLPSGEDPVCRQLLHSLLTYCASNRFHPTVTLTFDELKKVIL